MISCPQKLPIGRAPVCAHRALGTVSLLAMLVTTLCAAALVHASPVPEGTTSNHSIQLAAEQAIRARVGQDSGGLSLTLAPLDPRLRLAACDQPLQSFITEDGQVRHQTTVGVRCDGTIRWTIYTSVTVESTARVLVSRYALPREAMLTAADFDVQTRRIPGLASTYLADAASLDGQRLLMPVGAGQPLSRDALAPAPLVRRGQQVIIVAHASGIEVRMAGVALADGRLADHIRVQNVSSQRIVEAIIRSDSLVEAPL